MTQSTQPDRMAAPPVGPESARRAIRLLFAFEAQPIASPQQLAHAADVPLPTVHRYIAMLRDLGLVEEVRRGEYRLTMRVTALAKSARNSSTLVDLVDSELRDLSRRINETVLLIQPLGRGLVCTHRIGTRRPLQLSFEVGHELPALRGASARLHLGFMSESYRRQFIDEATRRGESPLNRDLESWIKESKRDAHRRFAVSREEIDEGVWAAAAPILRNETLVAIVSVPCLSYEVSPERGKQLANEIQESAKVLCQRIDA